MRLPGKIGVPETRKLKVQLFWVAGLQRLIPCLHHYDMPERHRQAVHFNMNAREGDYFIFTDWLDFVTAGLPGDKTAIRCSNRIMYVVKFDDAAEKDRFRRVLAACLFSEIPTFFLF